MTDLTIVSTLTSPSGTLNLQGSTYRLHADTVAERQVQQRKIIAKNPYVEGEYVVSAVKENITETLAVWVFGSTQTVLRNAVKALTDAFDQIQYTYVLTIDGATETWTCQTAEYAVKRQREYLVDKRALVVAQVPHRPTVVLS